MKTPGATSVRYSIEERKKYLDELIKLMQEGHTLNAAGRLLKDKYGILVHADTYNRWHTQIYNKPIPGQNAARGFPELRKKESHAIQRVQIELPKQELSKDKKLIIFLLQNIQTNLKSVLEILQEG